MKIYILLLIICTLPVELLSVESDLSGNEQIFKVKRIQSDGTVLQSFDGGVTWIAELKDDIKVLYISKDGCKYLSSDSGTSWSLLEEMTNLGNKFFKIYPNPVDDELNIIIPDNNVRNIEMKIFNASGVEQQNIDLDYKNNSVRLNAEKFSSGYYFVVINDGFKYFQMKFIKK